MDRKGAGVFFWEGKGHWFSDTHTQTLDVATSWVFILELLSLPHSFVFLLFISMLITTTTPSAREPDTTEITERDTCYPHSPFHIVSLHDPWLPSDADEGVDLRVRPWPVIHMEASQLDSRTV
jgi:hypothetical protein